MASLELAATKAKADPISLQEAAERLGLMTLTPNTAALILSMFDIVAQEKEALVEAVDGAVEAMNGTLPMTPPLTGPPRRDPRPPPLFCVHAYPAKTCKAAAQRV